MEGGDPYGGLEASEQGLLSQVGLEISVSEGCSMEKGDKSQMWNAKENLSSTSPKVRYRDSKQ